MSAFKDLTGMVFGRLRVIGLTGEKYRTNYIWRCICECGNSIETRGYSLTSGETKSCGCYHSDRVKESHFKHGKSNTRLYKIWGSMRERCNNKNALIYKDYGGKGINVCSEWSSFKTFYEWAICNGYKEDLTIDRINGKEGYSPENCRWTTYVVQNNNTSRNHLIEFNGETHTIAEWSRITGIPYNTMGSRIFNGKKADLNGIFKGFEVNKKEPGVLVEIVEVGL